eukprot:2321009-Prymnesium_polylepis.1
MADVWGSLIRDATKLIDDTARATPDPRIRSLLGAGRTVVQQAGEASQRYAQRDRLPRATDAELELPQLAAKLAFACYPSPKSEAEICADLATILPGSELLCYRPQPTWAEPSCWYLARGPVMQRSIGLADALFLVFRGTESLKDLTTDLTLGHARAPNGLAFHAGFLSAIRDDATLHARLRQHASGR